MADNDELERIVRRVLLERDRIVVELEDQRKKAVFYYDQVVECQKRIDGAVRHAKRLETLIEHGITDVGFRRRIEHEIFMIRDKIITEE